MIRATDYPILTSKMLEKFKKLIEKIENSPAPFHYFVLSFFFATFLRSFLECFSDTDAWGTVKLILILDYTLSYVVFATAIILLLHLATKTEVIKVAKVVLSGFIVLVSVPLIDMLLSGGKGYDIAYLLPEVHGNLLLRFITFFGEFYSSGLGATPGIRIEITFVLLGAFIYFFLKKIKFLKNIFCVFLLYSIIFSVFATPYTNKLLLTILNLEMVHPQILTVYFFPVVLFGLGLFLFYFTNKNYFKIILKDLRPFRLVYYEIMFFLGILIALKNFTFTLTPNNLFAFVFIFLSIIFAWVYSVMTNNLQDIEIDEISNKNRPLVKGEISSIAYKKIAGLSFFLALFYSGLAGFTAFFIILLFIGNYFLYSMPPFRLKRVPFFSKSLIALNSLILIMLGFSITSGVPIENLPISNPAFFLVLLSLTALINFIDIKDYEGDKQAGIKTLPVLLGLKRSKIIISIFFALVYLLVCFMAQEVTTLVFFLLVGGLIVYFINRKDYKEKYVFSVILASIFYLIIKFLLF